MKRDELRDSLNMEENQIDKGRPNRPGTTMKALYVTIHNTANARRGADARAHAKFAKEKGYYEHKGKKHFVSWHFTVDDNRVVQHLPINEVSYHAGSIANRSSIAIEICENQGIDREAAELRAARLAALMLYDNKLSANSTKAHKQWTGKDCPHLILQNGKLGENWERFKELIESQLTAIDGYEPPDEALELDIIEFKKGVEQGRFELPEYSGPSDDEDPHPPESELPGEYLSR